MNFKIVPITEEHIKGFWSAVDSVARERKYLAFLEGPPISMSKDFVLQNINGDWPHYVALSAIALYKKLGFEQEGVHKNGVCIDGKYENHIFMALLFT